MHCLQQAHAQLKDVFQTHNHTTTEALPPNIVPIKVLTTSNFILITSNNFQNNYKNITATPTPVLHDIIAPADEWERQLMQNIKIKNIEKLIQLLQDPKALITISSDGGAKHKSGSCGIVIANNNEILVELGSTVPGEKPDSFRAESYGMLTGLVFIRLLCQYISITIKARLRILSDSKSYLDRLETTITSVRKPRHYLQAAVDTELQIIQETTIWPKRPRLEHIQSHQDENTEEHNLTWEAKLNIQADQIALEILAQIEKSPSNVPLLPAAKVQLTIQNTTITHYYNTQIHFKASHDDYWNYLH